MAILEVNDLHKSFDKAEVLKGLSFSLEKGEALSVIGSSGSGKTTLLRCLNFLEIPTSGKITINTDAGTHVLFDSTSPVKLTDQTIRMNRLHFGLVFQNFNLFPQYTAKENIMLAPKLQLANRTDPAALNEISERADELLNQMGLSNRADFYPHQLSGGQQQRVAIARALALNPDILCFDEPTSALDPELTGEVLRVIRGLAEKDTTMIIVTHEMSFAHDVSDKVIFMDGGVIVEQGTPAQVMDNPGEERTRQFLRNYSNL